MIEREEPHPEHHETLYEKVGHVVRRFENLGGRAGVVVFEKKTDQDEPELLIDHNPHERFFAASTNKLAIAFALSHARKDGVIKHHPIRGERLRGAGTFDDHGDQPQPEGATTSPSELELLDDMLRNSGNTAAKLLKDELGAARINEILREYGHDEVGLHINPENGASHLGYATPDGLIRLFYAAVRGDGASNHILSGRIRGALASSNRPTGIRANIDAIGLLQAEGKVEVLNKSGEYDGGEDTGAPVRHDVGLIIDERGRQVAYAVMGQAKPSVLAEYTRHQVTANILEYAAGVPVVSVRKQLARRAFKRLGIRPSGGSHLHLL